MSMQAKIEEKLAAVLQPEHVKVENESHMHGGPATESHFKLTVVSLDFDGQRAINRHRKIYELLAEELDSGVHALALHLYTPQEWEARNNPSPKSPDCRGGSKVDS